MIIYAYQFIRYAKIISLNGYVFNGVVYYILGATVVDISEVVNGGVGNSILSCASLLVILTVSAYLGRFFASKRKNNDKLDDDVKIILGAILSLLGLLIGFVLSISINGYNQRQQTEENEAIAIGNAYQRIQLLDQSEQEVAIEVLQQYLSARIAFFTTGVSDDNHKSGEVSLDKQTTLWRIGVQAVEKSPTPAILSVLTAFSDLYSTQQKTLSSWRHQIPNAAWFLLIFFAISSNALLGYTMHESKQRNKVILILPFLTTLALFMIAEIDIPGEGIIHVSPDDLLSIKNYLLRSK